MPRTALILGATGRIGRHAATALEARGWTVRSYRRGGVPLSEAAQGVDLITEEAARFAHPDFIAVP